MSAPFSVRSPETWPGCPDPLGVTWDGSGVNVAVWSNSATSMEFCLFDGDPAEAHETRIPLQERTGPVWHGYVPGVAPGQRYGLRAAAALEVLSSRFSVLSRNAVNRLCYRFLPRFSAISR